MFVKIHDKGQKRVRGKAHKPKIKPSHLKKKKLALLIQYFFLMDSKLQ